MLKTIISPNTSFGDIMTTQLYFLQIDTIKDVICKLINISNNNSHQTYFLDGMSF